MSAKNLKHDQTPLVLWKVSSPRGPQTFQPATLKLMVPETGDPHRPWRRHVTSRTAVHTHYLAYVDSGINTTQNNNSLMAILLVYSNLRNNITRIQVISVYKQQHWVSTQYLINKHADDVCAHLYMSVCMTSSRHLHYCCHVQKL